MATLEDTYAKGLSALTADQGDSFFSFKWFNKAEGSDDQMEYVFKIEAHFLITSCQVCWELLEGDEDRSAEACSSPSLSCLFYQHLHPPPARQLPTGHRGSKEEPFHSRRVSNLRIQEIERGR